ncbi:MAG: hypothetical protein OXT09_37305, partial [Myxococcales bacterium]|nr:hypothetical protein [Myxococcales bacterium]
PCTLRPTPATLITGAALAFGLLLTEAWPLFSLRELVLGPGAREGARLSAGVAGWNPFYEPGQVLASLGPALLGGLWIGVLAVRGRCTLVVATCLALLVPYLAGTTVPVPLAHRLLLLATVTFHLACVDAVLLGHRALSGRRWWRPALAGLLLVLFVSNATLVSRRLISARGPSPVTAHARAVASACPPGCVVLGTDNDSWPLPAFGLRIVGLLHTNPLIPDLAERRHATAAFFARGTSAATRRGILRRYGITHVLLAPDAPADVRTLLDAHVSTRLTGGHTLYRPLAHLPASTAPP